MRAESPSASVLMRALARRHSGDVFVEECKNGPTQTGSHRRFDAWVLVKTWSPVTTIGYEVKVTRSDWRRDEKIGDYMGLCHLLYLVAPKGIVPVEELPTGVGLLELVGDQQRLVTRRKAARREIEMPASLLVYVLMCRVQVTRGCEQQPGGQWKVDALREWVNGKEDRRQLHYAISRKIQEKFDAQQGEIERVSRRINELERIERRIIELGFDPGTKANTWQIEKRLKDVAVEIDPNVLRQMEMLSRSLNEMRQRLQQMREPALALAAVDPVAGSHPTGPRASETLYSTLPPQASQEVKE